MHATCVTSTDFTWTGESGWYQVDLGSFLLDFYYRPSRTNRAFVFSPGWMDRRANPHPYFQRIRWFEHLDGIGISLADPTLSLSEDVQVGWFIGTKSIDYAAATTSYLARLLTHLNVPAHQTLFFGSSAGGFASLAFASHLRGSRVLAANPQTDITRFHDAVELAKTMRATFGGLNLITFPDRFLSRLRIADLWRSSGVAPRTILVLNTFDSWHLREHIGPLIQDINRLPVDGRVELRLYSDAEEGHNPPGPDLLLPMMEELLLEAPTRISNS